MKMTNKHWALIGLLVLLIAGVAWFVLRPDPTAVAPGVSIDPSAPVSDLPSAAQLYEDIPLATATVNALAAGVNYVQLPTPLPTNAPAGKVEVLEVFWYGCPHCNAFQPYVHDWEERMDSSVVHFERVPAPFNPTWETHARTYYTAEALGVVEHSHHNFFDAIHRQRQSLFSKGSIADYFRAFGVNPDNFEQVFDSFGVNTKINSAKNIIADWGVNGVPILLVNGKYRVDGSHAGSEANMIKVLELLIAREQLLLP